MNLLEIDPTNAERARLDADDRGLSQVTVNVRDAGSTDAYVELGPADVLLMSGMFLHLRKRDVAAYHPGQPLALRRGRPSRVDSRQDAS